MKYRWLLLVLSILSSRTALAEPRALQAALDQAGIERALQVARGTDRDRAVFHDRYVLHVDDPVVLEIEIITEFRRLVLLAEEQRRLGNWIFTRSARDAERALQPWRGVVTIVTRLRFNPMNAYVTVPAYAIAVGTGDQAVEARAAETRPQLSEPFPTRGGGTGTAILGAVVETRFDAQALGQVEREVRVVLEGATVASVAVDFGAID